jgi:LmbE family N-acetylglucosaminyl deacetylase/glycosyltransferase involved in cell wall biosynthesis
LTNALPTPERHRRAHAMTPKLSLLLITYNKLAYLRGALLALQLLDEPREDFEVIVIDDGSTDGTRSFLAEFEPNYTLRWASQANAGRSAARNVGAKLARGALYVILDDDFLIHPGSLGALWRAHQAEPERILISSLQHIGVGHVAGLLETIVRDGTVSWGDLHDTAPAEDEYALADLMRRMLSAGIERFAVPWMAAQGMSVSIPARVFARLEGYDERFTAYGMEDFDIGFRFVDGGGHFGWVERSLLYHLDHGHNRTVLFKESTVTTRAFYEKFPQRGEIKQLLKFLCGAITFKAFNNAVAEVRGMAPIGGFNLRFSPYGMIRYRDQQLGAHEPAEPAALSYTKAQEFRLRFLIDRVSADIEPRGSRAAPLEPMQAEGGRSVLVIAPHMDDEVIGCGGLIHQYAQAGSTVTVLFLSDGATRNLPQGEYAQLCRDRRAESERAADLLGVERCIYLGIPERNLDAASIDAAPIARVLQECSPDVILVPGEFEHHPDHRVANRWLRAALLAADKRPEILCYEVWGSCRPDRILRLDDASWRRKVRALAEYQTQLRVLDYQHLMSYLGETRGHCLPGRPGGARAEAYRRLESLEALA